MDIAKSQLGKVEAFFSFFLGGSATPSQHIVDECYDLDKTTGHLSNYFDYKRFADDLFMCDYYYGEHGNVFRRI